MPLTLWGTHVTIDLRFYIPSRGADFQAQGSVPPQERRTLNISKHCSKFDVAIAHDVGHSTPNMTFKTVINVFPLKFNPYFRP